jgi:probable phosphoglycerate mutase
VTDLLLIRHGEATHNREGRWEGWGATPLTETGVAQARAVGHLLAGWSPSIDLLYTSPILRALQTTEQISCHTGLSPVPFDGLREIDFGEVSGLTMDGFRDKMPALFAQWRDRSDLTFHYPGGEQRYAFFRRVGDALDEIVARHPDKRIAAVAHGGTIRAGLAHLLPGTMSDWWTYDLDNGSITHVRVTTESSELVALNDTRHVEGGS